MFADAECDEGPDSGWRASEEEGWAMAVVGFSAAGVGEAWEFLG